MFVLGIETTCDETGVAIVQDGRIILSNVLASSADLHEKYGGVFPELACRRHVETILPVVDEALRAAQIAPEKLDLIAVAKGPGLVGALLIGMNTAKGLSIAWEKPLIGINHVEAHLYASMMNLEEIPTPSLGIVLSGGHTFLVRIESIGSYFPIGTTVDDAIGEAFDKVASLLDLPYPGGPQIEQLAKRGDPKKVRLSAGKVKQNRFDFSFSGLKTAAFYAKKGGASPEDLAASFQETAFQDVVQKALLASRQFPCQALFLGGGVTANHYLREVLKGAFPHLPIYFPPHPLSLDNAAMIAGLAYKKVLHGGDSLDLEVQTRIPIA